MVSERQLRQGVKDRKAFNLGIWDPVENNSLTLIYGQNTVDDEYALCKTIKPHKSYGMPPKPLAQNMMKTFCQNLMEETNKLKS